MGEGLQEIKVGGWLEELLCKFFNRGMCEHEDAPKTDKHCIGMACAGNEELAGCDAWCDDISRKAKKHQEGQ